MVDEVLGEALAVKVAMDLELGARNLVVYPVLCVHRANLPWFRSNVRGVPVVSGKGLV